MIVIEPHIHMQARTTDDYGRMYDAGIRACVEPSFWLGRNRRYAGSFFDYFRLILEFETVRAGRFGIDHWACVAMNPKEADDASLARDVIDGIEEYLDNPRCVGVGEVGFNNITANEEKAFIRQMHIAAEKKLPVIIHTPHVDKLRGTKRIAEIIDSGDFDPDGIIIDHNTEETMAVSKKTGCWCGMTVYPISKLTPERVSGIVRKFGSERMIVNGSADWGVSDPLSLIKVVDYMGKDGHDEQAIRRLVFENANAFYSYTPKWKPQFDIEPMDPREFQR